MGRREEASVIDPAGRCLRGKRIPSHSIDYNSKRYIDAIIFDAKLSYIVKRMAGEVKVRVGRLNLSGLAD